MFIDKYNLGEPFIFIHPYKQKEVYDAVQNLSDSVDALIIFGSATGLSCFANSDIDACVVSKTKDISSVKFSNSPADILVYSSIDELRSLKDEDMFNIEKKI